MKRTAVAAADAIAVLLPVECSGCGRPDRAVCASCIAGFQGDPLHGRTARGAPVVSGARYDGAVARIIAAFKDDGRTDAARHLAAVLSRVLSATLAAQPPDEPPFLVPVPSSPAAYRRRGYHPMRLVLRVARLPFTPALRVVRAVADQAGLGHADRARNVAGAYLARPVAASSCILVDDVVTTGASLDEAERALSAAGIRVHAAVTLAHTPLRHAPKRGSG